MRMRLGKSVSGFQFLAQLQVTLVAAAADVPGLEGLTHGAARFVGVGAVAKAALLHVRGDVDEISIEFLDRKSVV